MIVTWTISWTNSIHPTGYDFGGGSYQVDAHINSTIQLVSTPRSGCPQGLSVIDTSGLSEYNEFFTCGLNIIGFQAVKDDCPPDNCRVDCPAAPRGFCYIPHSLINQLSEVLQG